MSTNNSDKTKIRKPAAKNRQEQDKTRLAPDKTRIAPAKTVLKAGLQNDKTRIAPVSHQLQNISNTDRDIAETQPNTNKATSNQVDDQTRITDQPIQRLTENENATRVDARDNSDVDKTVPGISEEIPRNLPLEPLNLQDMGDHGVLKKRFVLESVLGSGGMGIVYKAKDLLKVEAQDRDPYVAIKVLGEEFKSHPEAFISLQRESRKSQRIAHPNIVNVHDFDRDGDIVFMTMEFLDGSPLDQLIRRYKSTGLPTEDAWLIIRGICAALAHAHAEKIIHSDFKPGNVFVTKKGIAKVFDFGIARAVARVEQLEEMPEDKTYFDAGNLGALTPAYASLEMLEGKEPDIRDDVFALGCVAYELFTAEHPYKKIPADEAYKQGIKPKKINNITKAQWKAIQKAIAFKREDRIESIEKFVEAISPRIRTSNRLATLFALLLSVAITAYFVYFQEQPVQPVISELDIRNELELKIKVDYLKENLETLMSNPGFSVQWQSSVWKDVKELQVLTKDDNSWVNEKKQQIYQLYLEEINSEIKVLKYTKAQSLIKNARRYNNDETQLDELSLTITAAIKQQKEMRAAAIEREKIRKINLAKKQKEKLLAQQKLKKSSNEKKQQKIEDTRDFNVALENVNDQLRCVNRLNMRNIQTAVNKLREVDITRYQGLENKLVNSLASCITQTGKLFPERALEAKKHGLRIFESNTVLENITIKARDACDKSLAGLGSRGKRAICRDKILEAGTGPELVVIPGSSKLALFAIGKYEVSIKELNNFCRNSASCEMMTDDDQDIPVSGIDIRLVNEYMNWLSKNTGKKYRLPSKREWIYAAKSRRKLLDANRNCKLSTRGIQKGEGLVKANIGKQNSWGLVNYVGNVQEWVYDKGRKLIAVGGSYVQSMENCNLGTSISHKGRPDKTTGFRVVREMRSDS